MGNIVGSLAAPFIGAGLNKLLGTGNKNKDVLNFNKADDLGPPLSFTGDLGAGAVGLDYAKPSLTGSTATGGGFRLTNTLNPDGTVSTGLDASGSFNPAFDARAQRSLNDLDALRAGLTPGFGKVTQARRDAVENARLKAVGDLRDTLARRRIEGSSFGNASISQANAEFAKATADADAQSYLQELDATRQVLSQEFQQSMDTLKKDFSLFGTSAQMMQQFSDAAMRDNQLRMQLAEQDLSSRRSLFGQDLASRRTAGIADLTNRRDLAAKEEAEARKYFGGVGDKVGSSLGNWLTGGDFFKMFGLGSPSASGGTAP